MAGTASTRLAAGGKLPPDGAHTWCVRADLGFYAVACPFGRAPIAAGAALDATVAALTQPTATRSTLEKPACAQLRGAILSAGDSWEDALQEHPEYRGLGATLAAMLVAPGYAAVAHVGDCRVAQIRDSAVLRRTNDHVRRLEDGRAIVERFVGPRSNPEVHAWTTARGDIFVLTAGVHEVLSEEDFIRCLVPAADLSLAIRDLVDLAAARGGKDHLTAVALRVEQSGA